MQKSYVTFLSLLFSISLVNSIFNETGQQEIVDAINKVRREALPRSANVREVRWDSCLADLANSYLLSCGEIGSNNVNKQNQAIDLGCVSYDQIVGETTFYTSAPLASNTKPIEEWIKQTPSYSYDDHTCSFICEDYLQLVWFQTYLVGCATIDEVNCGKSGTTVVCNYKMSTVEGMRPYIQGEACSACEASWSVCNQGLCTEGSPIVAITNATKVGTTENPTTIVIGTTKKSTATKVDTTEKPTATTIDTTEKPTATTIDTTEKPTATTIDTTEKPTATTIDTTESPTTTVIDTTESPTTIIVDTTESPTTITIDTTESPTTITVDTTEKPSTTKVGTTKNPTTTVIDTTESPTTTTIDTTKQSTTTVVSATEKPCTTLAAPAEQPSSSVDTTAQANTEESKIECISCNSASKIGNLGLHIIAFFLFGLLTV